MTASGRGRSLLGGIALLALAGPAAAADGPRVTIWDLAIGMSAAEIPDEDLVEPACGTNGGPPGIPLGSFTNFRICPADEAGLREVTFIYDDELAYRARARRDLVALQNVDGTRVLDQPVITSVLFDDAGAIQEIRIVTDPKAAPEVRFNAAQLRIHLKARFGGDGWNCVALEPAPGEQPIGNLFIKERCRKLLEDGRELRLEANFFHKPGQTAIDRFSQAPTDYFESSARLEILSPSAAAAGTPG